MSRVVFLASRIFTKINFTEENRYTKKRKRQQTLPEVFISCEISQASFESVMLVLEMVEDFCGEAGTRLKRTIPSVNTMMPAKAIAPENKNSDFAIVPQRLFGETNSRYLLLLDEFKRRASASLHVEDIFAFS